MHFYACVFLLTNSPNTDNIENKTFKITENINQILPSQKPLLSLRKYSINPNKIDDESACEVNIILSSIQQPPCQEIMRHQNNSPRSNCQILQDSFWSMTEVGAICTNPYIFVYFKQDLEHVHIKSIGISFLNLLNLNPIKNKISNHSLNSYEWAFYNESCHEYLTNLSLKTILSLPNFYRHNDCLKNKTIANFQLIQIDKAVAIIIATLAILNSISLLKIANNIRKLWSNKNVSQSSTYIHMEDL